MKYKLVPVNPTREMWAAAGDAVVALNSQHHDAISEAVYKAMLVAAPVVEQQDINGSLAKAAADHLTNWLNMGLCECEGGHSCGRTEVTDTRDMLLSAAQRTEVEQKPAAWLVRARMFCGDVTTDRDAADHWEERRPGSTTPLYTHPQPAPDVAKLAEWAAMQWREQVESRPLTNIYRRTLDSVWRQVIRFAGHDDVALIGPCHDDMLDESGSPMTAYRNGGEV